MNKILQQYCSVNFKENEITAMLLMSTASYTHWMYPELVK